MTAVVANNRVAVTGASGFIGQHLVTALAADGYEVVALVRRAGSIPSREHVTECAIGDLTALSDDNTVPLLDDVGHIIHLASAAGGTAAQLRALHVDATKRLFKAAVEAGVINFIYTSSVRAVAGASATQPIKVDTVPSPVDTYGELKAISERWLGDQTSAATRATIVRLPMVYAENGGPNFVRLVRLVAARVPIPVAAVPNQRSILYVGNLTSFLLEVLRAGTAAAAAGAQTTVRQPSDGRPLATAELVHAIGRAVGVTPRLWTIPTPILALMRRLPFVAPVLARLLDSLVLERDTNNDWTPPYDSIAAVERCARALITSQQK